MNQDEAVKVTHATNSQALPTTIHSLYCPVPTRGPVVHLSLTCTFDQAVIAPTPERWTRTFPTADLRGAASTYVYSRTIEGEVSVVSVAVTTKRPVRSVPSTRRNPRCNRQARGASTVRGDPQILGEVLEVSKIKVFALGGTPPPMLPRAWGQAVKAGQGSVLAFAWSKADANAMLTDRGMRQGEADHFTNRGRLARGGPAGLGDTWRKVIEAGAIDPTTPGIYCAPLSMVRDSLIARIEPDGTPVVIARLDYDGAWGGRGIYVAEVVAPTAP